MILRTSQPCHTENLDLDMGFGYAVVFEVRCFFPEEGEGGGSLFFLVHEALKSGWGDV